MPKTMPTSAGDTLRSVLSAMEMTQVQLARRTDLSTKHISAIITGKTRITEATARKLEKVTGVHAVDWIKIDVTYRDALQRRSR